MKWLAPAKINLSLRVLGRRADGFHEIETLMAPLDLADEIDLRLDPNGTSGSIGLACSDSTLPTGADNLAYRAAALFRDRAGVDLPAIHIHLTKSVPHGAGLGGGSSDAATILLALNDACARPLTKMQLAALAAELGSDIPFFIYQSAAVCLGRGERVEPVDFDATIPLLLIKPNFPVPTPWAYKQWFASREIPGVSYAPQVFPWGTLVNDLERPVYEKYLVLGEIKQWLLAQPGVVGALLSGSGSTMIAVLNADPAAAALSKKAREEFGEMWTCLCHTAPRLSPGTSADELMPEISA